MAGNLYIVAAPSGAGKTTLVRLLLERESTVRLSVSFTTRPPRPGEQDGREYNFVSIEQFQSMIAAGDFLEWAEVHGNFYGTSKAWIAAQMTTGHDILLEIDWQGAQQVRGVFPGSIGIFILPPSLDELAWRLRGRGTDSDAVIAGRLAVARAEMRHVGEFDYVIINDDLSSAIEDLVSVVRTSRLRIETQRSRHAALFAQLL